MEFQKFTEASDVYVLVHQLHPRIRYEFLTCLTHACTRSQVLVRHHVLGDVRSPNAIHEHEPPPSGAGRYQRKCETRDPCLCASTLSRADPGTYADSNTDIHRTQTTHA